MAQCSHLEWPLQLHRGLVSTEGQLAGEYCTLARLADLCLHGREQTLNATPPDWSCGQPEANVG